MAAHCARTLQLCTRCRDTIRACRTTGGCASICRTTRTARRQTPVSSAVSSTAAMTSRTGRSTGTSSPSPSSTDFSHRSVTPSWLPSNTGHCRLHTLRICAPAEPRSPGRTGDYGDRSRRTSLRAQSREQTAQGPRTLARRSAAPRVPYDQRQVAALTLETNGYIDLSPEEHDCGRPYPLGHARPLTPDGTRYARRRRIPGGRRHPRRRDT